VSHQAQQAREAFGARLRELRKGSGLTGRALANEAGWHLSKVSRIEHGKQTITEPDLHVWCRIVGAEDQVPDLVATVRNIEEMWLEWRRTFAAGAKTHQKRSLPLYERTSNFRVYQPSTVWGTLQTADYAAATFRQVIQFLQIPDDTDEAVAMRMQRQQFLYKGDRRFSVVLGEQALYTNYGGPEVMRGQLDRLLAVMTLPRLSLGIIPRKVEQKIWPGHPFSLFDERLVIVETYSAELTVTQPRELTLYKRAFSLLQQSAVYGPDVRALIATALAEWERGD
jgi:transcriptional regulator with XRE-family HTH domain